MNGKPLARSLSIYNKTIVPSILAKEADLNDLSVDILSLRTLDEWNLNIAIEAQDEHDSTNNSGVATYQSYLEDQLQLHR